MAFQFVTKQFPDPNSLLFFPLLKEKSNKFACACHTVHHSHLFDPMIPPTNKNAGIVFFRTRYAFSLHGCSLQLLCMYKEEKVGVEVETHYEW